jgi:pSer/pThr/pTyr-binding forkhead associated (FHA) protein
MKQPPIAKSELKMASHQPTYSSAQSGKGQNLSPPEQSSDKETSMITLTLLHPQNETAIQTWRFPTHSVIRIGRSKSNEVTLYSAVVSRLHVEIVQKGEGWALISRGSNGVFCEGKRVNHTLVKNGMVIRLASSGPQIQIWTEEYPPKKQPSQQKISKEEMEKAQNTFPGTPRRRKLSKEELEQAKQTHTEDDD